MLFTIFGLLMFKRSSMKKIFSLFFVAVTISSLLLYPSCKKTQHPTKPTPGNYRILSISKRTDSAAKIETYTFSYDASNRLSQVIYTTNDSATVKTSLSSVGTRSVFSYSNDSIYKVTSILRTGAFIDSNIYIKNREGQIITAYLPNHVIQFEYYGKLLSRRTDKYMHNATSIGATKNYTSNNSDFLAVSFDGNLTANFPKADTAPFTVNWVTPLATTKHTATTYTDVFTGYNMLPVTMDFEDAFGHKDTVSFPGGYRPNESYGVFPDKFNRPGDYMYIESFIMFGVDIYQQAHLTKSITGTTSVTNVTYEIDADSKITTTNAHTIDSLNRNIISNYRFQYETY